MTIQPGTPVDEAPQPDPATGQDPPDIPEDGARAGNAEAAKYRTRLRETEAARDALTIRVEGLQRREVERLIAGTLAAPTDLFEVGGHSLGDFLDDDGNVDELAVAAAVDQLIESRPGLHVNARVSWPDTGGGRGGQAPSTQTTWADVLRPKG